MKNLIHKPRGVFLTGFGLLELVIVIGVVSVSMFALLGAGQVAHRAVGEASRRQQAVFLLEEGMEALRLLRDDAWSNISGLNTGQSYALSFIGGTWEATTAPQYVEGLFERTFMLREVFRDTGDNIATGGTLDPETRHAEVRVSWSSRGATSTIMGTSWITNLFLE
ncbi:MAG: hypothetical protein HYU35_01605 [Parcubacteria group bacterium]|nr:hypothetical protein [Parcubacteria group bacterium]